MLRPHYYNEHAPDAAAWLRGLIDAGEIPAGHIDTRSIEDVTPADLAGYGQHHFFAGIGGWPLALRLAGWPDSRPIWTGSCPCQPFSAAGKGAGFADERHLWPAFHWLIQECRPSVVFGEQVASAAVGPWLDLVLTDLEALGYSGGAIAFPAAGVGAPHIRDRTYWVANANGPGLGAFPGERLSQDRRPIASGDARTSSRAVWLADGHGLRLQPAPRAGFHDAERNSQPRGGVVGLADAHGIVSGQGSQVDGGRDSGSDAQPWPGSGGGVVLDGGRPGPVNGHWRAADWLGCRDGKWRPVEPGTFPLAHGLPARMGRLRGYGNAIVPQQAAAFIRAAFGGMTP